MTEPSVPAREPQPTKYLIWAFDHRQWWGRNREGYVSRPQDAGEYTRDDAAAIFIDSLPGAALPVEYLGANGGDEFVDLFPGSNGVQRAWQEYAHHNPAKAIV